MSRGGLKIIEGLRDALDWARREPKDPKNEVYLGIVRMETDGEQTTWVDVSAERLKGVIASFETECPEEVRHTLRFSLIPCTLHDNGDYYRGPGKTYIGVNGYRSKTAAEIDADAEAAKARVIRARGTLSPEERAEFERLKAKMEHA